jgi:hypothetical protein
MMRATTSRTDKKEEKGFLGANLEEVTLFSVVIPLGLEQKSKKGCSYPLLLKIMHLHFFRRFGY